MKIGELMRDPMIVDKDISLVEASKIMSSKRISSLILVKNGKLKSLITDKDLIENFGREKSISQIGTSRPVSVSSDEEVEAVLDIMKNRKTRKVPVIDKGELVGITTSKFQDADNMGFAIPTEVLSEQFPFLGENPEEKFSMKCPSCDSLIIDKVEWCDNCGNEIDTRYFEVAPLSDLASFVEGALSKLDINPVLARMGTEYWKFHQGSSQIRIFVYNRSYLYATSPLNNLPKKNLKEIFDYLLKDNVAPYKLGLDGNQIFIAYRIHISDIFSAHAPQIEENLKNLALKADDLDDFFVNEYGCEMTSYSKVETQEE